MVVLRLRVRGDLVSAKVRPRKRAHEVLRVPASGDVFARDAGDPGATQARTFSVTSARWGLTSVTDSCFSGDHEGTL